MSIYFTLNDMLLLNLSFIQEQAKYMFITEYELIMKCLFISFCCGDIFATVLESRETERPQWWGVQQVLYTISVV